MKLALGTVQFGMPYGVANNGGQVRVDEVAAILNKASSVGVDTLDTAIAYGDSERVLGEAGVSTFKLVTKLPTVPPGVDVRSWVIEQVESSCRTLGVSALYGLMLHRPDQLLSTEGPVLYQALQDCRSSGMAQKLGISVYSASELEEIYRIMHFDLVQCPLNILDRRLIYDGSLGWLKDKGVEIHARSLFLQGLLLMSHADRPERFSQWSVVWQQWHHWLEERRLSPLEACLAFGLQIPELDRLVVGVDSLEHFSQILSAVDNSPSIDFGNAPYSNDPYLINPANWNLS